MIFTGFPIQPVSTAPEIKLFISKYKFICQDFLSDSKYFLYKNYSECVVRLKIITLFEIKKIR